jgi:ABC-2 type transport system permease protein
MRAVHARRAFAGIAVRELLRFVNQRERFFAALVRPLVWLVVFAAGFRAALGLSIIPPYETYITYDVYIVPGLVGMIQLFAGMQSSLSMVYDSEMGSMRVLLTTPLPRWFLLLSKLAAGVAVSIVQVAAFLAVAMLVGIDLPPAGLAALLLVLPLTGLMLGAFGMLLASTVRQLENFSGVMNFVIFPVFFLSTALYPEWKMRETSPLLADLCAVNPFSHAVELVRFTLHGVFNPIALAVVCGTGLAVFLAAAWAFDPARRFRAGRTAD